MGLAISVAYLAELLELDPEGAEWFEEDLVTANQLLQAAGLPTHEEPRELPPLQSRAGLDSFPYSFIHYLRRAYAHRCTNPAWIASPLPEGTKPTDDPVLEQVSEMFSSHLLCHSDAEGFYFPIDFEQILFAEAGQPQLPGGMLGSSYRLREELILVAPALGIALNNGELPDAEAARLNTLAEADDGLYREYTVWLSLYEAARLSIQHKAAIVFN